MITSKLLNIIWTLLAVLIWLTVYNALEYGATSLVIEAQTFEGGIRKLHIVDDAGNSYTTTFELNGKWGILSPEPGKRMYVVELPTVKVRAISIEPLALPGLIAINRITLSDDVVSYTWNEEGACAKKNWQPVVKNYELCKENHPLLNIASDGSITIESIVDVGRKLSTEVRSFWAVVAAASWMCCLWLAQRVFRHGSNEDKVKRLGEMAPWLALVSGYLFHLFLVGKYAMNVPYFDEWDYFDINGKLGVPDSLSLAWLFDFWSEHIIAPTKLLIWLNLKLFSLNLIYDKIFNYLVYGLLILAIIALKKRVVGKGEFAYFPAFLIFLLSPLAHENHLWGFQSQTHFFLLLSIVPLYFAYQKPTTYKAAAIFCLLLSVNIFTFGAGVVVAVVYMACNVIYTIAAVFKKQTPPEKAFKIITAFILALLPCLYFRFHGYEKAAWTPPPVSPLTADYWSYFSNILSLGVGFVDSNALPGIIWLLIIGVPVMLLIINSKSRWEPSTWRVATAILGLIVVLGAISYGRGGFNEPKTSRYAEYGLMLIPLVSLAWWLVLKNNLNRVVVLSLLWLCLFISFLDTWSAQPYREKKQMDIFHLECIESYFEGTGDDVCQGNKRGLDRAAQLGVSFTRQFVH